MLFLLIAAATAAPLPEVAQARDAYRAALQKEKESIVTVTTDDLKEKCREAAEGYREATATIGELRAEIDRIEKSNLDPKTVASLVAPLKAAYEKQNAQLIANTRAANAAGESIPARKAQAKSASERAAWIDTEIAALDQLEGKRPPIDRGDTAASASGIGGPIAGTSFYENYANLPGEFDACKAEFGPATVSNK